LAEKKPALQKFTLFLYMQTATVQYKESSQTTCDKFV